MNESVQHETTGFGPAAFGDEPEVSAGSARVEVVNGVYSHSLPLAGMTVGQARAELQERMNIDPEAMAIINGNPADEGAVLVEDSVLTFARPAGEKGLD